jgi:two-component system response regulator PilR (NtrC family)
VITDMRLPDGLGMELLRELQTQQRRERCIVMTAYGSAENAVEALRRGLRLPDQAGGPQAVPRGGGLAMQGTGPIPRRAPAAARRAPRAP